MHDPEVIPLWFGESDLVTADFIRDAAKQALDEGRTFYNYPRGILPLREALQRYHARIYGLELHPDRITVAGLDHADRGVRHAVPGRPRRRGDPDRPLLAQRAQRLHHDGRHTRRRAAGRGAAAAGISTSTRSGAAITPRTKAVYVNSPSNPTGWVMTRARPGGAARPVPPARARADRRRGLPPQRPRRPRAGAVLPDAGRPGRAGVRAQRLLQGLGDDRLAAGLDGAPAEPGRAHGGAGRVQQHRRHRVRPVRRHRRPGAGRGVRRRVQRPLPPQRRPGHEDCWAAIRASGCWRRRAHSTPSPGSRG